MFLGQRFLYEFLTSLSMFLHEEKLEKSLELVPVHLLVSLEVEYLSLMFHCRRISNFNLLHIVDK